MIGENGMKKVAFFLFLFLMVGMLFAQVDTGGAYNTSHHDKQVIGYITQWDAWKSTSAGLPSAGALTHLNIDYSKYTILNFSFFGVALDGSLHSGDLRNKNIYQPGATQQPGDLFYTDVYSSWDLHILFGEIEAVNYISQAVADRAKAQGFDVQVGASTWSHPDWRAFNRPLPLPLNKEGGAPGLLALAHAKGVKVMASIGGWSMCKHFPEMAADPAKRKRFVDDCVRLINIGFDGIDLDWEYPGPFTGMNFTGTNADYENFKILVQEIRTAIGPNKLVTAAFSADTKKLKGFDWNALENTMDYFNFMTYDFNGGWSNIAGHNSPIFQYPGAEAPDFNWEKLRTELAAMGVDPNKTNMGVPFYGRGVITNGNAELNKPTVKRPENIQPDGPISTCADYTNWPKGVYDGTPNHFFIKQKALGSNSPWTRHWDSNSLVPYLTNGKYFLSYDDEQSVAEKASYVKDNNMSGIIIWTVFGDLEISGSATSFGTKLKRWSNVKSPLINKINEVFAQGGGGNKKPTVSITQPSANAQFNLGDSIVITAQASDPDGNVTQVEFFNHGQSLGIDSGVKSSYSITWNNAPAGSAQLKAVATDNEGAKGQSVIVPIKINDPNNQAPQVEIISPVDGAVINAGSNLTVTASNSDSDGTVAVVEFFQGTVSLGKVTNPGPSASITWKNVPAGNYTLTAVATDNQNASTTSSAIKIQAKGSGSQYPAWDPETVYVKGNRVSHNGHDWEAKWWTQNQEPGVTGVGVWIDLGPSSGGGNQAPSVNLTQPSDGATFNLYDTITLSAQASDTDGSITQVEFFYNTTSLGVDNSAPYQVTWSNLNAGTFTLKAVATDNEGAVTNSASIQITVQSNTLPPVPAGLTAQVMGTSRINVSWNAASGATGYDLEVDGNIISNAVNPYSHTGLAANSNHNYRVRSKNSQGTSGWSGLVSATTDQSGGQYDEWQPDVAYAIGDKVTYQGSLYECIQPHTSLPGWTPKAVPALWKDLGAVSNDPPQTPGGLLAQATSMNAISVTWNAAGGATGYDLEVDGSVVANVNSPYQHTGLNPDSTHTYRVRAKNSQGTSAWSNSVSATTHSTPTNPPATPTGLSAQAVSQSQITVTWNAASGAASYDLDVDGSIVVNAANPYHHKGLTPNSTHTYRVRAKNSQGTSNWSAQVQAKTSSQPVSDLPDRLLVGYWHNFTNQAGFMTLRDVSQKYDVINIAFSESLDNNGNMGFTPYNYSVENFKADVTHLKSQGKKVLISIGGANSHVQLPTLTAKQNFINSMINIITTYGFDGMDIDLEGSSICLGAGDGDFRNPSSPVIVNLIDATLAICNHFGSKFVLTMAPETAYVQGGYASYGNIWGAYLPLIHAVRDKLTYIHVQYYNSGTILALDDRAYAQGTADFIVGLTEMLVYGFNAGGHFFNPLREDQVAIGLPACHSAAGGGYTDPATVHKALNYLIKGQHSGGAYNLKKSSGYPKLRGVMTWSINWDAHTNSLFSNSHRSYLDALP